MGKTSFKDLTGKKFGRMLVIKREEDYVSPRGYHLTRWLCKCSCGNEKIVLGNELRRGDTKSCGCFRKEKNKRLFSKDLRGSRFGRLLVLKKAKTLKDKKGKNIARWLCQCDCGNTTIIRGSELSSNSNPTQSCGCLRKEIVKSRNKENTKKIRKAILGKNIGRLKIIEEAEPLIRKNGKKEVAYLCLCDCGNYKVISGSAIYREGVSSCGCVSESVMAIELKKYFKTNHDAISEYSPIRNPKTNHPLYFDIYIPAKRVFIEVNGEQHYSINKFFNKLDNNFENQKYRDKIKRDFAKRNGIYIEIDLRKHTDIKKTIEYIEKRII